MAEGFMSEVERLTNKILNMIDELKKEIDVATENVKNADRELAECPKEDASENAQLQTARENQARANHVLFMLQKRLQAFESCVSGYTSIGVIQLGTTVELTILSVDGAEPNFAKTHFTVKMVAHDASDSKEGFVSVDSAVGMTILGKVAGDVVKVTVPKGVLQYRIERIY